ncbi:MAG: AMP-binding protein, partial [Polyangiales bacterium]
MNSDLLWPVFRAGWILYEDADLVAVNKAPGITCQAADLNVAYPADRLALMAEDAGLAGLLTDGNDAIPDAIEQALGTGITLTIADSYQDPRFTAPADPSDRPAALPAIDPDALAYTLYTSGSTGKPKGVSVTHGNVTSLLDACAGAFALSPDDRWCLFHAYAFDFSVWEIWGALAHGGSLVIVPYTTSRDPQAFHQLLIDKSASQCRPGFH